MGQLRADIGLDLFGAGGRVCTDDKGHGDFAGLFIGQANHGCILNLWMGDQTGLQFRRGHLEPFVFYQLFETIHDEHVAIRINDCHIAGFQPAIRGERISGGCFVVEIANHDLWPFDPKLAFLPRWQVLPGLGADNSAAGVGKRKPRCP